MLRYTGHPLIDVGVATITAFAEKHNPADLTESDLDKIAEFIAREYSRQPLMSFLTVAFPNSGFTQPAYNKSPEKRQVYAKNVLYAYRENVPKLELQDVFTGEPVVDVSFDVKGELIPGYAYRQHIPLITGEDVINFHPYGVAGIPVSGTTMLALQAFPLGCAKCGGRLLAVHSDNPELTFHFTRTFLIQNRRLIQLAQSTGSKKMPEAEYSYRTLLIDLLNARWRQRRAIKNENFFSITAYYLTNSGQGADLKIYHLPSELIGFLKKMQTPDYQEKWNRIVERAWEVPPKTKRKEKDAKLFKPRRNWLYEDLFRLPENANQFVRLYFLRVALWQARGKTDPAVDYSFKKETDLVSWKIVAVFLRRIMHMDKDRIEQIRKMGDRLADYVSTQNDRRFFRQFFMAQRADDFRIVLIKANNTCTNAGKPPLINFDPYIEVFELGSDVSGANWKLARDLVLIRMVEVLYEKGWFSRNQDAIPEPDVEQDGQ